MSSVRDLVFFRFVILLILGFFLYLGEGRRDDFLFFKYCDLVMINIIYV